MKKVKITVLRKTLIEDLAKEYGTEGLTKCPMLQEGQVFYADYAKPKGFCDEAWKAIYQYVFALAHGAGSQLFYYGDWIRKPGVAICSCNDGWEWLSVVVTMVCVRLSLSWKRPTKRRKLIIHQ